MESAAPAPVSLKVVLKEMAWTIAHVKESQTALGMEHGWLSVTEQTEKSYRAEGHRAL
jgi:hypothetical protein